MSRQFSLGYRTQNWSSFAVGVSKPLTDTRIRRYIREGKYGNLRLITSEKPKAHIRKDREIRKLVSEYQTI